MWTELYYSDLIVLERGLIICEKRNQVDVSN